MQKQPASATSTAQETKYRLIPRILSPGIKNRYHYRMGEESPRQKPEMEHYRRVSSTKTDS
jgi:hypothetical protein